jgi:hypothetical protein
VTNLRPGFRTAGLLVAAALLSGCTTTPQPTIAPAPSTPPAASTSEPADPHTLVDTAGDALEFPLVELDDAKPLTLPEIASITPAQPGHDHTILLALSNDRTLVTLSPSENFEEAAFVKSNRVGLLRDDGTVDLFADTSNIRPDGRPRQTYAGDINEQWVVWMETSSDNMYESNWRLFAQELDGGKPILVAAAEDQRKATTEFLPLAGGDPFPRLSEGLVWWWTAHEQPDGTFQPRILAADPAGGEPKEMLALSAQLSPVTGGIVAVTLSEAEDHPQTGIVRIDTDGTVTELVRFTQDSEASWGAQRLASSGNIVAMSTGEAVLIMDTSATPIAQIPIPNDREIWDLDVCAGKVVFTPYKPEETDQVAVYDTTTNTLQTIHVPRAETDNYCSDQRISWSQNENNWTSNTIAIW